MVDVDEVEGDGVVGEIDYHSIKVGDGVVGVYFDAVGDELLYVDSHHK